jgi:hypothetical protein
MPRQIIDTESSQPAYVRRKVTTFVVIVVVLVVLAAIAWAIFRSHAG